MASRDPADELRAAIEHTTAGFGAALRPLAEAYLRAADQLGAELAEFARQVGEALGSSHGTRAELGDPTGDPPARRGDSRWAKLARELHGPPPPDPPGFTCPRCGRTSYHPRDLAEGYCGACHDWTGRPRG